VNYFIKYLLLIFGFYFLPIGTDLVNISFAQSATSFMRTFKAAGMNGGLALVETSDGGFAGTGQHETSGAGSCDIYVYKVDDCGNPEWFKTYGSTAEDGGRSIQQTADGGYIVAGLSHFGAGGYDITLLKIDALGNVQWTKVFGGGGSDYGLHAQQTADGGYILTGFFTGLGFGGEDAVLIKTDTNGNLLWMKLYGGAGSDWGDIVEQTSDGGYLLTGYTTSFGAGSYDIYVIKLDATGNIIWSKTYGGSGEDGSSQWGITGTVTSDGSFLFCANTKSYGAGDNDVLLIKTDSLGSLQWSKTYGGTGDDQPRFAEQTSDGGFIIIGSTTSFGAGDLDTYLIKTDNNGNLQWSKAYGGSGSDRGSMVKRSPDGGYALSIVTSSFGAVYFDALFMKTDSLGVVGCNEVNCATIVNTANPSVGSGANQMAAPATVSSAAIITNNYFPTDVFLCLQCSTVPTFTISNTSYCIGNTISFYNTTTTGGKCTQWYINGSTQGFQDTLSMTFTAQGIQNIQLVAYCGSATDTSTISIDVSAFNAPVASFNNNSACKGDTTLFIDNSINTSGNISNWTWDFGNGSAINNNQNPEYIYPAAGSYNVLLTVENIHGCIDTSTQNIIIHPLPIVLFDTILVCKGDTVQFNNLSSIASPGTIQSWLWNFGDGSPLSTSQNPYHYYNAAGNYSVKLIAFSDQACSDSITINITISAAISATAAFGTDTLCSGGMILLGGNTTATGGVSPYTYLWSTVASLSDSTISNPIATILANTSILLIVTDSVGCKAVDSAFVSFNPAGPFVDAGFGTNSICTGGISLLGGAPTASGGAAPYAYSWLPAAGLSNNLTANPTANIIGNTTYKLTITDNNACQNIDSVNLLFNPSGPFADAGFGNDTSCTSGSILLGGAPTAAGGTPPYTYNWLPAAGLTNTSVANPTAVVSNNNFYVLYITDANGCQNLDTAFVIYNAAGPIANAGFNNMSFCTGGTLLIGGAPSAAGGMPPYSYLWTPSAGISNIFASNPTATITQNASYALIVSDNQGCQNIDSISLIYTPSGPFADAGFGNNTLCSGGTILLGGTPTAFGGTAPYVYSWLFNSSLNDTSIANPLATINTTTTFILFLTDSVGCMDIDSVIVTHSNTGPFAHAGFGNNALCYNYPFILGDSLSAIGGLAPYSYNWLPSAGLNNSILSNPTVSSATTNTIYYLTVTDANGCKDLDSTFVNILGTGLTASFVADPLQGIEPLFVQFTNQSLGFGLSYQWYFGDNGVSNIENPNHIFHNLSDTSFSFIVRLVATDTNGCIDTAISSIFTDPTNINTYPNIFTPNGDNVNDIFKFGIGNITLQSAIIYNRWGEKMFEWMAPFAGWDGRTTSGMPASNGIYFYVFTAIDKDKNIVKKTGSLLLTR